MKKFNLVYSCKQLIRGRMVRWFVYGINQPIGDIGCIVIGVDNDELVMSETIDALFSGPDYFNLRLENRLSREDSKLLTEAHMESNTGLKGMLADMIDDALSNIERVTDLTVFTDYGGYSFYVGKRFEVRGELNLGIERIGDEVFISYGENRMDTCCNLTLAMHTLWTDLKGISSVDVPTHFIRFTLLFAAYLELKCSSSHIPSL